MTVQKSNQKNNNRIKERRRKRKEEMLEKRFQDRLYQEAKIDPNTVEGQSTLDISRICHNKDLNDIHTTKVNVNKSNEINNEGYFTRWYNYLWGT